MRAQTVGTLINDVESHQRWQVNAIRRCDVSLTHMDMQHVIGGSGRAQSGCENEAARGVCIALHRENLLRNYVSGARECRGENGKSLPLSSGNASRSRNREKCECLTDRVTLLGTYCKLFIRRGYKYGGVGRSATNAINVFAQLLDQINAKYTGDTVIINASGTSKCSNVAQSTAPTALLLYI